MMEFVVKRQGLGLEVFNAHQATWFGFPKGAGGATSCETGLSNVASGALSCGKRLEGVEAHDDRAHLLIVWQRVPWYRGTLLMRNTSSIGPYSGCRV